MWPIHDSRGYRFALDCLLSEHTACRCVLNLYIGLQQTQRPDTTDRPSLRLMARTITNVNLLSFPKYNKLYPVG